MKTGPRKDEGLCMGTKEAEPDDGGKSCRFWPNECLGTSRLVEAPQAPSGHVSPAGLLNSRRPFAADDVGRLHVGHLDKIGEHVAAFGLGHCAQLAEHRLHIVENFGSPLDKDRPRVVSSTQCSVEPLTRPNVERSLVLFPLICEWPS